MTTLEQKLFQTLTKIIELLGTGKAETYANMDFIKFEPGTVDKMNQLLAQRNLLIDMIDEENDVRESKS